MMYYILLLFSVSSSGACITIRNKTICHEFHLAEKISTVRKSLNISSSCRISEIPTNGYAVDLLAPDIRLKVNDFVRNGARLRTSCAENHHLIGDTISICLAGHWIGIVSSCQPFCDPNKLFSISSQATCYWKRRTARCTDPIKPGTIAKTACKQGYENLRPEEQIIFCGPDGRWSAEPAPCTQICGEETAVGSPFVAGGSSAGISQTPWHVAIYKAIDDAKYEQICSGTILNARIVISAMHCFWDRANGLPHKATQFMVKAGKSLREFDDSTEVTKVQSFFVKEIHGRKTYNDRSGDFVDDIALLLLAQFIEFKTYISPICIKYDVTEDEKPVGDGFFLNGSVAGWGRDDSSQTTPSLKTIELQVIDREKCKTAFPEKLQPLLTSEKFCAGALTGKAMCSGDDGGGFVFSEQIDERKKYFLRGIVTVGPSNMNDTCNTSMYSLFTNTAYFLDFISYYETRYRLELSRTAIDSKVFEVEGQSCQINAIPSNGVVASLGASKMLALGEGVRNFGAIQYSCDKNHTLVGETENICISGEWTNDEPECRFSAEEVIVGKTVLLW